METSLTDTNGSGMELGLTGVEVEVGPARLADVWVEGNSIGSPEEEREQAEANPVLECG